MFFVISGFVITGVLLRERTSSGRTSLLTFYGRRCRRIVPAATLVLVVTIVAAYVFLGVLAGGRTATDARWAAIFLVNVHFASEGTNYLAAQQLPSALQNFWSLSVEEQFYLVYPTIFLLLAAVRTRISLRTRLAVGLGLVMIASFALSVAQTSSDPTVAYFSPFTRAWELALGGLVAVGTSWLLRIPAHIGAALTWLGLGAILVSAVVFNSQTAYPGSLVAVPVIGAALIIAGGTAVPRFGAESLLRLAPCAWLGNLSYSLYLWHWPILIIAAEYQSKTSLTFGQSLPWLALSLLAAIISYSIVENPIRHANFVGHRRWGSVALGIGLIVLTLAVATVALSTESGGASPGSSDHIRPGTDSEIAKLVAASTQIQRLPADLTPSLQNAAHDYGAQGGLCDPPVPQVTVPPCVSGDRHAKHTMVLFGDSHAQMWYRAMNAIAAKAHWRLVLLGKGYCMANQYPPVKRLAGNVIERTCQHWQTFAFGRIKKLDPDLVVITQEVQTGPGGKKYTTFQWQHALEATISRLSSPRTKFIVLGNTPTLGVSPPDCLAQHPDSVQDCSSKVPSNRSYANAERRAVTAKGGRYIDVEPWFCATRCSSVIGHYEVYLNQLHITKTYSLFLENALAQHLDLSNIR